MALVWIISDVSLSVTNVLHYRRNRVYLESRESKCKYRIHLGSPDSAHPGRRGLGNWCGELLRRLSGNQAASLLGFEVRKGSRCRGRLSALARARRFLERPVSGAGPRRWRPEERAADYLQQPGLAAPPRPPAPNPPPTRPRRRTTRARRAPGTRWREPGPSAPGSGASSLRLQAGCPPPAP